MNLDTNEISEVNMKFTEFQHFLETNPSYKQAFTRFPATVDPVRVGVKRPDDNFLDVLKNVKHNHKKNTINDW
jgi:hypothetical protein